MQCGVRGAERIWPTAGSVTEGTGGRESSSRMKLNNRCTVPSAAAGAALAILVHVPVYWPAVVPAGVRGTDSL